MLLKLVILSCSIALGAAAAIEKNPESDNVNQEHENSTKIADDDWIILDGPLEKCEPGRKYRLDCNTCFCSENGMLGCTLMGCLTATITPIQYPELPEGPCEVGKKYQKDCNVCSCGEDGVPKCGTELCTTTKPDESKKVNANDEVILVEKPSNL